MKGWLALLVWLAVSARLGAQTAAELEAKHGDEAIAAGRAWVHDGDRRHLAWAAYWAARDRLTELEPDLVKELNAYRGGSEDWKGKAEPDDVAAEAVADALIRVGAHVPVDTAAVLYPKLDAQAMILLSRASGDPQSMLEGIFNSGKLFDWLAAADLLAQSHPTAIAMRVLRDFTMELRVDVVGAGQKVESGPGSGCVVDYLLPPTTDLLDWPPMREYKISAEGTNGTQFAPGIHPVYFLSWETHSYFPYDPDNSCHLRDRAKYNFGLIEQLSGWPKESMPLKLRPEDTVVYSSDGQYVSQVEAILLRQRDNFEAVVHRFRQLGLITEAEASASQLSMDLTVNNQLSQDLPSFDLENFGIRPLAREWTPCS